MLVKGTMQQKKVSSKIYFFVASMQTNFRSLLIRLQHCVIPKTYFFPSFAYTTFCHRDEILLEITHSLWSECQIDLILLHLILKNFRFVVIILTILLLCVISLYDVKTRVFDKLVVFKKIQKYI